MNLGNLANNITIQIYIVQKNIYTKMGKYLCKDKYKYIYVLSYK